MSLDAFGGDHECGNGCALVVFWILSGPGVYYLWTILDRASKTKIITGWYRNQEWQISQAADPNGYLIAFVSTGILFVASVLFFFYGIYLGGKSFFPTK